MMKIIPRLYMRHSLKAYTMFTQGIHYEFIFKRLQYGYIN